MQNPAAGEPQRRVSGFTGLALAKELLTLITKRHKEKIGGESCWGRAVEKIKIGHTGFGNAGEEKGATMCAQWIQSYVQAGCPKEWFDGWEEVRI